MKKKRQVVNYEITVDPHYMDEQHAMTEELRDELTDIFSSIEQLSADRSIIKRLEILIEKHPRNPQLKNHLGQTCKLFGDMKRSYEVNQWIRREHPDYLFGKLNLAIEYFEKKEYEKMPEILGKEMDIQMLYPNRKVFHLAEVTAFYRIAVIYFCAVGKIGEARSRYEYLEKIAPGEPDTLQACRFLMAAGLETVKKNLDDNKGAVIKVKTREDIAAGDSTAFVLAHEELRILYREDLRIGREELRKILALPRESLIPDLEQVLKDCMTRHAHFKEWAESQDCQEEFLSFPVHAIFLLGELRSEGSLEIILEVLGQNEDFLEFWFGDLLSEALWEPLYYLANKQTGRLKSFVFEPGNTTSSRALVSNVVYQIACQQPDRRDEVISWYRDVLNFFINAKTEDNVIDTDTISLMIGDVVDLGAECLLPEINALFRLGYVDVMICGDPGYVDHEIRNSTMDEDADLLMDIYERYEFIVSTWYSYNRDEDEPHRRENLSAGFPEDDDLPDIYNEPFVRKEKKTGRNEPCPCGSGKKYKNCCLKQGGR